MVFQGGSIVMILSGDSTQEESLDTGIRKVAYLSFRASGMEGLSRILDPSVVLSFQNSLFEELRSVIESAGGLPSGVDGARLTAVFGPGGVPGSHCLAAVEGAGQLLDRFRNLTLELREKGLDLRGGAGISWGRPGPSTASMAEALERLSGPDSLLVTPEVAAMSGCRWTWEEATPVGTGLRAQRRVGRRESAWLPIFTPDHPDYSAMMEAWERFLKDGDGASGGVALIGEPGLGKNGLAEEYASQIARGDERVVVCSGFGPGGTPPLGMWFVIGGQRARPGGDHLPPWLGSALKELAGTRRRAVVLVRDVHCADESSLRVLSRLIVMPPDGLSLFFILVGEHLPEQLPADRLLMIAPEPLDRAAITSLLRESLPGRRQAGLLETLAYSLHKSTMGYPLFVQQTLFYLLSSGRLARSGGGEWTLEEPLPGLPPSVEAVLHTRIDALPGELRLGLLLAGLLGRSFSRDLFLHVHETFAGPDGDPVLQGLAEAGFLSFHGPLCHFRGSLLAEAAAGLISETDARAMHGIAGDYLSGGRTPGPDETLALETAGHLAGAGRFEEALPWALTALEQMTAAANCIEGLRLLEMLRAWPTGMKDTGSERRMNMAAFNIHSMRGDYGEALDLYGILAPEADPEELARLEFVKAKIHTEKGQTLEAVALLERILSEYGADGPMRASVLCRLSKLFAQLGNIDRSREYQDLALEMVARDPSLMECILGNLAMTRLLSGDSAKAEELCRKALETNRYGGNLKHKAQLLSALSIICMRTCREREGMELSSAAAEIHRRSGNFQGLCGVLGNTGTMLARSGRLEPALEALSEALDMARKIGNADMTANYSASMGNIFSIMNRFEESEACFRESLEVSENSGNTRMIALALNGLGTLNMKTGVLDQAEKYYQRASRMHQRSGNLAGQAQALAGISEVNLRRGIPENSLKPADDARRLAAAGGDTQASVDILFLRSRILLALGRPEEALDAYREACLDAGEHGITISGIETRKTLEDELREMGVQISTNADR
jgi:tetratricopeptide (TPR) repeat protein